MIEIQHSTRKGFTSHVHPTGNVVKNLVLKQISLFVRQYIAPHSRVLVGLSGGVDSTVLLDALSHIAAKNRLKIVALHVDHGLRGAAHQRDRNHCRKICKERAVPLTIRKVDVKGLACQKGYSLELAARRLRRECYLEVAHKKRCGNILLAHTRDDQVETLLFRIMRGCGLHGLTGIHPVSIQKDKTWCRPFLGLSKKTLIQYAADSDLAYVLDETNNSLRHDRNRIRHQLVPLLEQIGEGRFPDGLLRLSELAFDSRNALMDFIPEQVKSALNSQGELLILDSAVLKNFPVVVLAELLREKLATLGESYLPPYRHCQGLHRLLFSRTGSQYAFGGNWHATKDRGFLLIGKNNALEENMRLVFKRRWIPRPATSTLERLHLHPQDVKQIFQGQGKLFYHSLPAHLEKGSLKWIRGLGGLEKNHIPMRLGSKSIRKIFAEKKMPYCLMYDYLYICSETECLAIPGIAGLKLKKTDACHWLLVSCNLKDRV